MTNAPQLPTIAPLNYHKAQAIVEDRRKNGDPTATVESVAREHYATELAKQTHLPAYEKAQREIAQAKAELVEKEQHAAEALAIADGLSSRTQRCARLDKQIKDGEVHLDSLDVEGRISFLKDQFGGDNIYAHPRQWMELGQLIAGCRVCVELLPGWLEEKRKELEAAKSDLAAFIKTHGITLPDESAPEAPEPEAFAPTKYNL